MTNVCTPAVIDIIGQATEKDPKARIADFDIVLQRLRAARQTPSQSSGGRWWIALLATLVGTGIVVIGWIYRGREPGVSPPGPSVPAATTVALGLEFADHARDAGPLTDASLALRNSDRFRLVVRPSAPGHTYVFAGPVDGSSLNVLFPSPLSYGGSSHVESDRPVAIPETTWLEFEAREGRERIWIVWSRQPYAPFETAKQWSNIVDRGRIRDAAARARLASALAGTPALTAEGGRLVLTGATDLLVGVLEIRHR